MKEIESNQGESERETVGARWARLTLCQRQLSDRLMLPRFKSLLKTSDHTGRLPVEDLRQALAGGAGKLHLLPATRS